MAYKYLTTEELDGGLIQRITLNREKFRNAQNRGLLVELGDAFLAAEANDDCRVVILAGTGPLFSSGHDLGTPDQVAEREPGPDQHFTFKGYGATKLGAEKRSLQEWHFFFENTLRWRNLRKVTIAQVHGQCFAAALMLAWCCDFIVAAEDAEFTDVVGTRLGMCGLEYFAHPFEFGPRKAKELLMTGDALSAEEACRLGMVTKIFKRERLAEDTLAFARRIAARPSVTSLLIKESVNQAVDNMGFYNALNACFTIHQLNHAHWAEVTGGRAAGTPEFGVPDWRTAPKVELVSTTRP
jgi:enoyl-CoA hydratase